MRSFHAFSCLALATIAACGPADEPTGSGNISTISPPLLKTTYSYRRVITAGDPLPGGASCGMYFSLDGLNSRGDLAFGVDIPSGYARYQSSGGHIQQVALPGDPLAGGITLGEGTGFGDLINETGTQAFVFLVDANFDQSRPSGRHNGVFTASTHRKGLTPIMLPDQTLAPGGHPFRGAFLHPSINNREEITFTGMIETPHGIHLPMQPYGGLGLGVFMADRHRHIKSLAVPGSPAPGGGTKITDALAPVFATASCTVSNTGQPSCVVPPLPGVTPPTTVVPYAAAAFAWNVPSRPVRPWTMSRVFLSISTAIFDVSRSLRAPGFGLQAWSASGSDRPGADMPGARSLEPEACYPAS